MAALILGALTTLGLQPRVRTSVSGAVCQILHEDRECGKQTGTRALSGSNNDGAGDDQKKPVKQAENKDECHGFWGCTGHYAKKGASAVGGVFKGVAEGAWSDLQSMYDLAQDPKKFVDGLKYAIEHPGEAALSMFIDDEVKKSWAKGDYTNAVGRVLWNVGSMGVPVAGVTEKLLKLGKLEKLAKARKAAEAAEKAKRPKVPKAKPWKDPADWRKGSVHFDDDVAYQKWLDDTMGPKTKALSEEQRQSVYNYRRNDRYREINESLRGERPATREAEQDIKNIDAAMERSRLPNDVITTRTVGDDAFDRPISKLKGSVQSHKGYTSVDAASKPGLRMNVVRNMVNRGAKPVQLHLKAPKGTKAVAPGNLKESKYAPSAKKDSELILGRNTNYRIDHVEKEGDSWVAYGTVVP